MKILLVDDYRDSLDVWRIYLHAAGFEVEAASDGIQGLQLAREVHPDVIVMDLNMPGLSGMELAEALQAKPETAGIPRIAVTGNSRSQADETTRRCFSSVILKPCEPEYLIAEIWRCANSPTQAS